ncbi:hypothetical protein PV783_13670 [Chitinophaga sp. CC14]|uniref:hypothetical protein n=1 Tax=Chitinophaga sp. CC14 TaxID=3029199 RepID=UPI003B7938BC
MRPIVTILFSIVLLSCSRGVITPGQHSSLEEVSFIVPTLVLTYGEAFSASFNVNEISCVYKYYEDPQKRTLSITANNGKFAIEIDIETDSIRLQSYSNCLVRVARFGQLQGGQLLTGNFALSISGYSQGRLDGAFSGHVYDPFSAGMISVGGFLNDVPVTLN